MFGKHLANGEKSSWLSLYLSNHDSGKVTSIFQHSLNIQFPNVLFHVGRRTDTLSCLGITLPDDQVMAMVRRVSLNDIVRLINGTLYLYTATAIIPVPFERLTLIDLMIPTELTPRILTSEILLYLSQFPFQQKWGLGQTEQAEILVKDFKQARSAAEVGSLAARLVGKGQGLTPSGDDVMVGATVALTAFSEPQAKIWQDVLGKLSQEGLTTDVSEGYLRAVADGVASQKLIELLQALRLEDGLRIRRAIEAVVDFGHTSGVDTLFGFWCGLKIVSLSSRDKKCTETYTRTPM